MEQDGCIRLADQLIEDGWDDRYVEPLRHVTKALKIGFSTLDPPLESYFFGRIVLVSDACHPPTPYLGQGAQMGLEDAGTLALLLKKFCMRPGSVLVTPKEGFHTNHSSFDVTHVDTALLLYDQLRRPRAQGTLSLSKQWGGQQQRRAASPQYNKMREEAIRRDIFYHETLPILLPVVRHDYAVDVRTAIAEVEVKERVAHLDRHLSRGHAVHHMMPVPEEASCCS